MAYSIGSSFVNENRCNNCRAILRFQKNEGEVSGNGFGRVQAYLISGELQWPQKRASAALWFPHIRHIPRGGGWSGKSLSVVLHQLQ
jgi:hypothetical protein